MSGSPVGPLLPGQPAQGDEPVFREPWEAHAFALTLTLHQRGLFTWPEWAAALADEIGARAVALDVTDPASVDALAASVGECRVLVNNAGGALGLDPVAELDEDAWQTMYDTNVLGDAPDHQGPAAGAAGHR